MGNITCFGEVLWDEFLTHRKIGGAPLNVAARLKSLDCEVSLISKIGHDQNGETLFSFIKEKGIETTGIQIDAKLQTGTVKVTLDKNGSASYDIVNPSAWDNIELNLLAQNIVESSTAFVYGSLIARNESSKATLYALLELASYKIFDVNLRAPHYSKEVILHLMKQADFIKFNDDEIFEIAEMLDEKPVNLEACILFLAEQTNTSTICVTKGENGAIFYVDQHFFSNKGYSVKVVDTVGAGDSFLATLISKYLNKENPQDAIDHACAVGALVASREGANPVISEQEIAEIMG